MDIGQPERSGRHRVEHEGGAVALSPGGRREHAPGPHATRVVRPDAFPVQRTRDPLVDTDAVGLRKFNIGLVPASVTPPRTWKRAAWFAVASSAAVLVGLAYAAAKLVGADSPDERIGMPGYPTTSPLITGFGTTTAAPPALGEDWPDQRPAPRPDQWSVDQTAALRAAADDDDRAGTPGTITGTASPDAPAGAPAGDDAPPEGRPATALGRPSSGPGPSTSPTVTTVPSEAKPLVDGAAIAFRTERFFEEAVADATAALAMVADVFRTDAEALLEQRFADVAAIEVTAITVDPTSGATVSTLQMTKKDGSTTTERRELVFTTEGEPLINAERLIGTP
ncbi:hypothetical protein [Actinosynnema sp. NPDC023587]|uniref:hypothetical protein n=1 Tax=Actinosynnema sp. NPDC023587 TaxID=3154695 RepID=UPI0033D941FF